MSGYGRWTALAVDADRCLVYGPRLGRFYMLATAEAADPALLSVLGLNARERREDLPDPADRILHDRASLKLAPPVPVPRALRAVYRLLRHSRHVMPLAVTARLIRGLARGVKGAPRALSDIGRLVECVEKSVGLEDCYPRALLTAWLCLRSGRACELVVGALVPTRLMHVWCVCESVIPFEPLPQHYMYRPLAILPLAP